MSLDMATKLMLDAVASEDALDAAEQLHAALEQTRRAEEAGEHATKVCFVRLHVAHMFLQNVVPRLCNAAHDLTEQQRWDVFGRLAAAVRNTYDWFDAEVESGSIVENIETTLPKRREITRRLQLAMGARVA